MGLKDEDADFLAGRRTWLWSNGPLPSPKADRFPLVQPFCRNIKLITFILVSENSGKNPPKGSTRSLTASVKATCALSGGCRYSDGPERWTSATFFVQGAGRGGRESLADCSVDPVDACVAQASTRVGVFRNLAAISLRRPCSSVNQNLIRVQPRGDVLFLWN